MNTRERHIELMRLCQASYSVDKSGYPPDAIPFDFDGTQGFVLPEFLLATMPAQVVVFRGTDEIIDWLHDFDIDANDYKEFGGYVHHGFAISALMAYEIVTKLCDSQKPIYCTGHSLGGALATLFSVLAKPQIVETVTFGCPRVFLEDAADANKHMLGTRYVNRYDLVPTIPMETLGYRHIMETLQLGQCHAFPSLISLKARITDHYASHYLAALTAQKLAKEVAKAVIENTGIATVSLENKAIEKLPRNIQ